MSKPARPSVVYIAGPYTAPDAPRVTWNISEALSVRRQVEALGYVALVPHIAAGDFSCAVVTNLEHRRVPVLYVEDTPWEAAMARCRALLACCEAVVMVDGWRLSRGACEEKALAEKLGIPVFLSVEELRNSLAEVVNG